MIPAENKREKALELAKEGKGAAEIARMIDRVIEQLSLERSKAVISLGESKGTAYEFCDRCVLDAYEKAIAIVKGGWNR